MYSELEISREVMKEEEGTRYECFNTNSHFIKYLSEL